MCGTDDKTDNSQKMRRAARTSEYLYSGVLDCESKPRRDQRSPAQAMFINEQSKRCL